VNRPLTVNFDLLLVLALLEVVQAALLKGEEGDLLWVYGLASQRNGQAYDRSIVVGAFVAFSAIIEFLICIELRIVHG